MECCEDGCCEDGCPCCPDAEIECVRFLFPPSSIKISLVVNFFKRVRLFSNGIRDFLNEKRV